MGKHTEVETVAKKEKNANRVAAGKTLAERNKKYKEHFEKTAGTPKIETAPKAIAVAESNNLTYFIVGAVILGIAGFAYYQSQQKPIAVAVTVTKPVVVEKSKSKPNRLITV